MVHFKGIITENVQSDVIGRQVPPPSGDIPPPPVSGPPPGTRDPRLRSLISPNKPCVKGQPSPARANQGRALANQRKRSVPNQRAPTVANKKLEISIKNLRKNYEKFCKKNKTKLLSVPEGIVEVRRQIRKERGLHPKRKTRCPLCCIKVNDRDSLWAHCQARHRFRPEERGQFHCSICRLNFNGKKQEEQHLKSGKHEKKFKKFTRGLRW